MMYRNRYKIVGLFVCFGWLRFNQCFAGVYHYVRAFYLGLSAFVIWIYFPWNFLCSLVVYDFSKVSKLHENSEKVINFKILSLLGSAFTMLGFRTFNDWKTVWMHISQLSHHFNSIFLFVPFLSLFV